MVAGAIWFSAIRYLTVTRDSVTPRSQQFESVSVRVCVCVHFFYDDKVMGNHIIWSQLEAAAPEFSFPLSDKPVSQPALFQTLVGHSVNVVRRVL